MNKMIQMFRAKAKDQKGATMVEYALMLALIAAVCVGVVTTIGTGANSKFGFVNTSLNTANP
jgi:pilus assembly protein Flp/PilA